MSIKYKKETVNVLKLVDAEKMEIYNLIKLSTSDLYRNEASKFDNYELPVVTSDYRVLTHMEDVKAAYYNGCEEMEVIIAEGLDENEFVRFCIKGLLFKHLENADRIALIILLTDYFRNNPAGMKWADELTKKGEKDINDKLAEILNCSKALVKKIKHDAKIGLSTLNEEDTSELLEAETDNKLELDTTKFELMSFAEDKSTIKYDGKKITLENKSYKFYQKNEKLVIEFNIKDILNPKAKISPMAYTTNT